MYLKGLLIPDETVVEYRNGEKRLVVASNNDIQFRTTEKFGSIDYYDYYLDNVENHAHDIVKIYKIIEGDPTDLTMKNFVLLLLLRR